MNAAQQPAVQNTPTPFHSASLYVGDLAPDVSEGLLFEIFNAVGPVASIRVCRDTVTRRSLGYAYVNFHNVADAERALDTMNFTLIKQQPCRIMWSQRDPALRRSGLGNIFVKNLSPQVDHKALYDTFSLFGNIMSCKLITDPDGQSKGYGYVHYETAESAADAIAKINGMLIAGEKVYVGHFVRRQDRAGQAEWTNLYVKNVPLDWDSDKLREVFAECGEVTSAVVQMKTEGEGAEAKEVSAGFGFVNMATHEAAAAACETLTGRKFPDETAEGGERELYAARAQKKAERERALRQKFEALKAERLTKYQGVNLYVKNLDDGATDDQLRAAFAPYGTITSAKVMRDAAGASKGFGFVCYSQPEEAAKAAAELNGKNLGSKPLFVALAAATPEQQKNMIGERLYPLIAATQPELCGKITGMLLEMDNGELLHLLEAPDALATKIAEALTVLEQHNAALAAQQQAAAAGAPAPDQAQ